MEQNVTEAIAFTLESTYPGGYMTKCSLPKSSNCNVEIACLLDEPLYDYVEIEHQAIRDRFNELFTFTAIHSYKKLNWGGETSTEEEEEAKQNK